MGTRLGAIVSPQARTLRPRWVDAVFPYGEFALALLAAGLWYTQGGAVWYTGSWPGPWPLTLLGLAWMLRLVRTGLPRRLAAMDLFLGLFLISAGVGVWAAYDRSPAWAVFWLIVGAMGLYYAVSGQPDGIHQLAILAFWGLAGGALAIFFLATHDWSTDAGKFALLVRLGRQLQSFLPSMPGHRLSPNVAGGLLAMLLPLYVPLVLAKVRRTLGLSPLWAALWSLFWALVAGVTALGWVISMSRGAWVGLLGASGLWVLWHGVGWWSHRVQDNPQRAWRLRIVLMIVLLTIGLALALGLAALVLAGRLPGQSALANRLELFRDALLLARDYRLIGVGLGMFQIQFSIYTLLIHVGYIVYSHNMLLSILTAQGILGLVPYLGLVATTVIVGLRHLRRLEGATEAELPSASLGELSQGATHLIEAALASLAVLLIHGLVDDILYGSRGALLLFIPCALMAAAATTSRTSGIDKPAVSYRKRQAAMVWSVRSLVMVTAIGIGWRNIGGAWYANVGALEQARVELSVYDPIHFDKVTMDQARQVVNLDKALRLMNRAKAIDPRNPTARQRLASINLSRRQYPEALAEMQAAWDAGHRDSVTRLLYGEALVATGEPERAAEVLRGLKWAEVRLLGQAWSRYWESKDYRRARDAWATVLLLNPASEGPAYWRAEAEKQLSEKP